MSLPTPATAPLTSPPDLCSPTPQPRHLQLLLTPSLTASHSFTPVFLLLPIPRSGSSFLHHQRSHFTISHQFFTQTPTLTPAHFIDVISDALRPSSGRSDRLSYGGHGHDLEIPDKYSRGLHDGHNGDLHDKFQKINPAKDNDQRLGVSTSRISPLSSSRSFYFTNQSTRTTRTVKSRPDSPNPAQVRTLPSRVSATSQIYYRLSI